MSHVAQADIVIYLRMLLNLPISLPKYCDYRSVQPLRIVYLFEIN